MKTFFKTLVFKITPGLGLSLILVSPALLAQATDITGVAGNITGQATAVSKLLSVVSYVAGVGFAMAGILQFKAHKENPQQVPLSKPIVMLLVAACLLFLPTVMNIAGVSIFGSGSKSAAIAGGSKDLGGH